MIPIKTSNKYIKKWLSLDLERENSNVNEMKYPYLVTKLGTQTLENDFIENSPCREEHLRGEIYLHNASEWWIPHCAGISLVDVLMNGYDNSVVPPRHLDSAISQSLSQWYIYSLCYSGALAYSHFDTLLAPFIFKDKLLFSEVKKHLKRTLYFIESSIFRRGQSLFVNVTLDLKIPNILKEQKVLFGFEDKYIKRLSYEDFQDEVDVFNRAFFELLIEGKADHTPFTFPLITINYTEEIEKEKIDSDVLNLMYELTEKYGTCYFRNLTRRFKNDDYDVRSYCCHLTQNDLEMLEFSKRFNGRGLWNVGNSFLHETGGINVANINLNRIALLSSGDLDRFFSLLKEKLEKTRRHLMLCRTNVALLNEANRFTMKIKKMESFFNIVSIIGGYEALHNLNITNIKEITDYSVKILKFIRSELEKFMREDKVLYGLEAAPAEKAGFYLGKKDKEFGEKIGKKRCVSGYKHPFITPGFNVPIGNNYYYEIQHRKKIDVLFNSGTIYHIFHSLDNINAKEIIQTFAREEIPYFTISPTMSICRKHGVSYGLGKRCKVCGRETIIISKIVGYMRPLENWSLQKREELLMRPKEVKI